MKWLIAPLIALAVTACAANRLPRIQCEKQLAPINRCAAGDQAQRGTVTEDARIERLNATDCHVDAAFLDTHH